MEKRAYHHGDLHSALVDAGLALIATRAADDLSLREVAREVGVSATAVYRHFPDKGALMRAVAHAGAVKLGAAQRAAFDAAGGGVAGFSATGAAYVRFALANPALFRLIFANPVPDGKMEKTDQPDDAMTMLLENAAMLAPEGMDPRVFALQAWSIAHGLAMLLLDEQLKLDDAMIDTVIDAHLLSGKPPGS
jgi:AcrR family transcriptional regulator